MTPPVVSALAPVNKDSRSKRNNFNERRSSRLTGSETERGDVQQNDVFQVSRVTGKDTPLDGCSDGHRFVSIAMDAEKE